jgi:hypothetical protein
MAAFGMRALYSDRIDGYEFGVMLFALAVFAISPAVLLLLERPLAGIDKWTPSGTASEDEGDGNTKDDAAGGGDKPANDGSRPAGGGVKKAPMKK